MSVIYLDAEREEQIRALTDQARDLRVQLEQAHARGDGEAQGRLARAVTAVLDRRAALIPRTAGRLHTDDEVRQIRQDVARWQGEGYRSAGVVALAREKWGLRHDHAREVRREVAALIAGSLTSEALDARIVACYQTAQDGAMDLARHPDPRVRLGAIRVLSNLAISLTKTRVLLASSRAEAEDDRPLRDSSTADILARLQELRGTG